MDAVNRTNSCKKCGNEFALNDNENTRTALYCPECKEEMADAETLVFSQDDEHEYCDREVDNKDGEFIGYRSLSKKPRKHE